MVTGISHITFVVKDLCRTKSLLETVFGAVEVYSSGEKIYSLSKEKFFLIGDVWVCIMQGEPPAQRGYGHVAFSIGEDEVEAYEARIRQAGAEIRPGRERVEGEGHSLYFYDFDNHLFELHTGTLEQRLERYRG